MDDNEELRYFIVSILRKEYHIIEAENGKKGLEIIRLELPDLVLSDVMMPCMDGIELLEEVKRIMIPVIYLLFCYRQNLRWMIVSEDWNMVRMII